VQNLSKYGIFFILTGLWFPHKSAYSYSSF